MGKCQSCGREKLNINLLQGKDRPVLHFQYPNAYLPLMTYYDNRKKAMNGHLESTPAQCQKQCQSTSPIVLTEKSVNVTLIPCSVSKTCIRKYITSYSFDTLE